MANAYWVATYRSISNPDALAEYAKLAGPAIQAGGGRFLARGTAAKAYEKGVIQRVVVIEFQFGLFLAVLVFALFFALGFARLRVAPGLERVVGFVAGYSYSLYLVHHTLVEFLAIHYPDRQNSPTMFWAAIAAANLLAVVFWYLFERHHRQLARWAKQRFASDRPSLGIVAAAGGLRR